MSTDSTHLVTTQPAGQELEIIEPSPELSATLAAGEEPITEEDRVAQAYSEQFRVPLVKLASLTIDPESLKCITEETARKYKVLPVKVEEPENPARTAVRPTLVLAMANPGDFDAIATVEFSTGCKVTALVASQSELEDAVERYYAPEQLLESLLRNISATNDIKLMEEVNADQPSDEAAQEAPAVKLVNLILQHALQKEASDIHLEPTMYDFQVRVRVGGILEEFTTFPKWLQAPITSRIKIMARLNIAEHRRPQDGRIKLLLGNRDVDLRVSTLPTHFGETTVLRLLGTSQKLPETRSLGFRPRDLDVLKRATSQPQGMIVVTGPTGSGKTTTLYTILNEKKSPSINIVTIEDPIEIQLPGLNQVQVNVAAGMTFASCMRSLLRQDPDVVLLGEVRDSETAEIAIQAAQTGHLVLTTLHANSTTATISRIQDLGVEPRHLAEAVNLFVAQRLLRRICQQCIEMYEPAPELVKYLGLERHNKSFLRGKGCKACAYTGYEGRYAIYELLPLTPAIRELILRRASEAELRRAAVAEGMSSLLEQAVQHIKDGITTCDEVTRVVEVEHKDPSESLCPQCSKEISPQFVRCPHCCAQLKRTCGSCRQELRPEWPLCPYCGVIDAIGREMVGAKDSRPTMAASIGFVNASSTDIEPTARRPIQFPRKERRNTILVVDDVELNRRIAVRALEKLPFQPEILEAKDGFEALEMIDAHKPDLILLDLMMPGMSGFEVCSKIREHVETAFIPVIMLTASTNDEHRVEGYLTGTDDYMTKPFAVPDLHARVTRAFRRTYGV